MATSTIRRAVLDGANNTSLARLLRPHAPYLSTLGIDLDALSASSQDDRAPRRRIYAALNDPSLPAPPAELVELLAALDALASSENELVRLDTERVLPRGTHGPVDLALFALLEAPELAAKARKAAARDREHKFVEYAPASPLPPITFDKTTLSSIRERLVERFEAIDHTGYCDIVVDVRQTYVDIEIEHGARARTRDIIDPAALTTSQTTDVTAQRSYARFHRATGRLAVHAARDGLKELVRSSFGHALFGDAQLYRTAGLYDLAPFRDLEAALSTDGVPGLLRVELLLLTTDRAKLRVNISSNEDITGHSPHAIAFALGEGEPSAVKLALHFDGAKRKKATVELSANGKHNSVKFARTDPAVVAIVEAYLRARGVLSEPDDGGQKSSEAAE